MLNYQRVDDCEWYIPHKMFFEQRNWFDQPVDGMRCANFRQSHIDVDDDGYDDDDDDVVDAS